MKTLKSTNRAVHKRVIKGKLVLKGAAVVKGAATVGLWAQIDGTVSNIWVLSYGELLVCRDSRRDSPGLLWGLFLNF